MNHGCVSLSRRSSVNSRKLAPFMVNQEAETAVKDCDWCPPRDGPCGGPLRRVTSEGQGQKLIPLTSIQPSTSSNFYFLTRKVCKVEPIVACHILRNQRGKRSEDWGSVRMTVASILEVGQEQTKMNNSAGGRSNTLNRKPEY